MSSKSTKSKSTKSEGRSLNEWSRENVVKPFGLNNKTSSVCYFNALCQALFGLSYFNELIIEELPHLGLVYQNKRTGQQYPITIEEYLKYMNKEKNPTNDPDIQKKLNLCTQKLIVLNEYFKLSNGKLVINNIDTKSKNATNLLSGLIKATNEESKIKDFRAIEYGFGQDDAEFGLYRFLNLNPILEDAFNIKYDKIVHCNKCGYDISGEDIRCSVHLGKDDYNTYHKNIRRFLLNHSEKINDYKCDNCEETGNCEKIFNLRMVSEIIVITIKKYELARENYVFNIPTELHFTGPNNKMIFKLTSEIEYYGSGSHGHYKAISRRSDSRIYSFNDETVTQSGFNTNAKGGYMLFYHLWENKYE